MSSILWSCLNSIETVHGLAAKMAVLTGFLTLLSFLLTFNLNFVFD